MARNSTDPQIAILLQLLDESYEKKAWHGPNLRGSIRGLTLAELLYRPGEKRHNIWEIVVHAAYWKYIVRRRLRGENKGSFPLPGSNWFQRPITSTPKAWKADVALLDQMHRDLRAAIANLSSKDLPKVPPGSKLSHLAVITGIASHDVYHTGQVQLLKRMAKEELGRISRRGKGK
jgi:uncharacterized damage-inducible protein DinB